MKLKKIYTLIILSIMYVTLEASSNIAFSKQLLMDISRTHGYVTSQNYILEKIKKKYPDTKYKLDQAQMEFNLVFKPALDNIDKFIDYDEWHTLQKKIYPDLIAQADKVALDSTYKNGFANEIMARSKGQIESPVLETLLMFHPKYQKYPIREFTDGFKKRLHSKDNSKAKGVDFHIEVPKSWKVNDGKRPHVLWMTYNNNGYLDEDNGQASFGVIVRELPETILSITQQDAEDFCNEMFKGMHINECMKTTVENLPAIYARTTITLQRLRVKMTMEVANYLIFYNDRLILLQGAVNALNNELPKKQLNKKYDKFLPLFDNIANSLVINDIYTETNQQTNDFYIYKLFDNKFQAVFPNSPSIQEIPKELLNRNNILKSLPPEYVKELTQKQIDKVLNDTIEIMRSSQPLIYADMVNKRSYTAQSMPSGLEHENYIWSGIKNMLDKQIKDVVKTDNRTLINFSSTLDKDNDVYIAIHSNSYYLEGQKVYSSTKQIYYKDRSYKWSVSYVDKNDQNIFDEYQHNVKVLQ